MQNRSFKKQPFWIRSLVSLQATWKRVSRWQPSSEIARLRTEYPQLPAPEKPPAGEWNLGACIGCSLCTYSCSAVRQGMAPPGFEPKRVLLGMAKTEEDWACFDADWVPCVTCPTCTVVCPTGVPVHRILAEIRLG